MLILKSAIFVTKNYFYIDSIGPFKPGKATKKYDDLIVIRMQTKWFFNAVTNLLDTSSYSSKLDRIFLRVLMFPNLMILSNHSA